MLVLSVVYELFLVFLLFQVRQHFFSIFLFKNEWWQNVSYVLCLVSTCCLSKTVIMYFQRTNQPFTWQGRIYSNPGPVQEKMWGPHGRPQEFLQRGNQMVWGTEVPQRCPGAEPRWWSGGEAPRSWRNIVKNDIHRHHFPHVGAPFLWGPLFGRTCWTCLNPPLVTLCSKVSLTGPVLVKAQKSWCHLVSQSFLDSC